MRLSVVIPVYNVEKYLDECVESAIENLNKQDEIILVDDGSMDASGLKCDVWAGKDERITAYHKPNGGLMSAWKYGVIRANGKYIGFIDSDDWVDTDMYSTMIEIAEKNKADIVCSGLIKEYSDGSNEKEVLHLKAAVYRSADIRSMIFPSMIHDKRIYTRGFSPNRVTKLFTKELLLAVLNACDDRVSIGEDLLTCFACFNQANCICVMNDYFPYHYRINNTSMIMQYKDSKYEKIDLLREAMLEVNRHYDYDFGIQIHNDYISLILGQLDQEMLFSLKPKKEIYASMKRIYSSPVFRELLEKGDRSQLSTKNKVYIVLMARMKSLLLFIRKIKSA